MISFASSKSAVLTTLMLFQMARAHTVMTTIFVDGVNQGDGVCIRMNNNGSTANTYIQPVTSPDIACGIQGEIGGARVCPTNASSTLTFEFREQPSNATSLSLDPSHKGPASVYLKRVDSAIASNNAAGDGWFKIWQSVYDESVGKWGTEKMIDNDGHISVAVPADIESGYYLARTELLALHAADAGNPQFYVGCAQLFITSTGVAKPPTVTIGERTYDLSMAGLTYNIYMTPLALPYPMFGPPVYSPGSGPSSSSAPGSQSSPSSIAAATALPATASSNTAIATGVPENKPSECSNEPWRSMYHHEKSNNKRTETLSQTQGLKPEGCIFVNGNWCGFEVPDYTDQNSCWNASDDCWRQSDNCWNTTQPTGYNNCEIWQDQKCKVIAAQCNEPNPSGPPNKGVDFTPKWPSLQGSMDILTKRNVRGVSKGKEVDGDDAVSMIMNMMSL